MNIDEANKIVALYMGGPYEGDACSDSIGINDGLDSCTTYQVCERCMDIYKHYLSLDALVLVWEKLSLYFGCEMWKDAGKFSFRLNRVPIGYSVSHRNKTVQEAACIATARAIEALNE